MSLRSVQNQSSALSHLMSITGVGGWVGVDCEEDGSPCGLSDDTEIEFGTSEEGITLIQ